jgi:hypothetical protein
MVSRPVSLGVNPHLGPKTRFLLLSNICSFFVGGGGGGDTDEWPSLSFTAVIVSGLSHLYAVNMYLPFIVLGA